MSMQISVTLQVLLHLKIHTHALSIYFDLSRMATAYQAILGSGTQQHILVLTLKKKSESGTIFMFFMRTVQKPRLQTCKTFLRVSKRRQYLTGMKPTYD